MTRPEVGPARRGLRVAQTVRLGEGHTHPRNQLRGHERLGQQILLAQIDAVAEEVLAGIARHIEEPDARMRLATSATSCGPIPPGIATSVRMRSSSPGMRLNT